MKNVFNLSVMKNKCFLFLVALMALGHFSGYSQTAFSPGNLVLLRTSSGSTGTYGSAVFLDEYTPAGTFVRTITLPSTAAPSLSLNNSIFIGGTAGSNSSADEGRLSLSSNNQYLTFSGYANAANSSVSQSSSIGYPRTIARVKYDGTTSFLTPPALAATSTALVNLVTGFSTVSVSSAGSGTIATGQYVFGPGITSGTTVTSITSAPGSVSATWTAGSSTITCNTTGLVPGIMVTGTGIPSGAFITAVSGSSFTLSSASTTGTGSTISFSSYYTLSATATTQNTLNLSFVAPSVFAAVATGGSTSSSSGSVTGLTVSNGSISTGMYVYGASIANGTTVSSYSSGTLNMSGNATATSTSQTLFFTSFPLFADKVATRSAFTTDGSNFLLATAENTIQYYNSNGTTPSGVLTNTTGSITNLANGSTNTQARYFFPYNNKIYMSNGLGNNKLAVLSNSSSIPTSATAPTGFTYATGSATPFSPTNFYIVSQNGTDVLYVGEAGQTVTSNSTYPTSAVSNGASTVTVNSTSGIAVGQYVSGTGIQTGTYVKSISGSIITLSQATNQAIATSGTVATSALTFSGQQTTSSTASGNTVIAVGSATNIAVGQFVVATSGGNISTAIPSNTIVTAVSGTNITLSNATTASLSGLTLTFHYYGIKKYYYNTTNSNWVAAGGYGVSSDQFQGIVVSPPSTNSATIYAVRNAPATATTAAGTLISFVDGAGATSNFSLSGSESNLKVSSGGTFRSLAFAPSITTTNYYYNGSGSLTSLASWGSNTDGSGFNPADFTSDQQVFNLRNVATIPALTANWTVSGTASKIVVGDATNACTFTIPSGFTVTGTVDVAANGTLSIANVTSPTFGILSSSGTVVYSGTVAQTIPSGASFTNLSITNTNAAVSAGGALSVSNSINIAANATLDMVANPLTFTGTTTTGTGTLATQSTSGTPLPTGKSWTFTVTFNNPTGGQTIPTNVSTTFNNLTIGNTSGTNSPNGTLTVNGNLALSSSGSILDMKTNSLVCSSASFATSGSGTFYTQNVSGSTALNTGGTGKTWNFAVVFNGASSQTLPQGQSPSNTFNNLTINNTGGTVSFYHSYVVNGVLTISSGSVVYAGTGALTGSFSTAGTGRFITTNLSAAVPSGKTFTFEVYYGSYLGNQTIVPGNYAILDASSSSTAVTTTSSTGTTNPIVVASATGIVLGQTVSGANIPANATVSAINGTSISLSTAPTATITGNITFGTLGASVGRTLPSGTVAVATSFVPGSTAPYTVNASNVLSIGYSTTLPTLGSNNAGLAGLTITAGTVIAPSSLTVSQDFTISGGTFIAPSGNFTVGGNWSNSATYTHNNGTVLLNGTNQTFSGTTTFFNLSKSVAAAATLTFPAGLTQTIAGTLTLNGAAGKLLTLASSTAGVATINAANASASYLLVNNVPNTGTNIAALNSSGTNTTTGWTFSQAPTWTGTNSSNWNDDLNWSTGVTPTAGAVVTVDKQGSFDLVIETSPNIASLSISAGNNVSLSNGRTLTLNGSLTADGGFTANATSSVVFASSAVLGGSGTISFNNLTVNAGAALSGSGFNISGTWINNGSYTPTSGTVTFNGSGTQTIPAGSSLINLSVTNTNASVTASGALTVSNSIDIQSGATLDMGTNVLTFTGSTTTGTGILATQNTSLTPIPVNKSWSFTVHFNNATGGQTVPSTTNFGGLKISNTSGNNTASGTITVSGNLDITSANSNLSLGTNSLVVGTGFSTSGNGTLSTANLTGSGALNTSSLVGSTGQTWNFTVRFNGAGKQTFPRGVNTFNNLIIASADTTGLFTNTVVNGLLTINAGSILSAGTATLTGSFSTSATGGMLTTRNTTANAFPSGKTFACNVAYISTSSQTIVDATYNNGLDVSGGNRVFGTSGTVVIAGAFTPGSGTFTGTGSSVTFSGSVAQTVPSATYSNLSIRNTSATASAAGNITITGNLEVAANAVLNMGTNVLNVNVGATTSGTGTLYTQNTASATPISGSVSWTFEVNFNNANGGQTVPAGTYNNLTIANTGGTNNVAGGSIVVNGNLAIANPGSSLDMNTKILNCTAASFSTSGSGTLYNQYINFSSGITTGGSAKTWNFNVVFNATNGPQTLPQGSQVFTNLTIANTSGNSVSSFGNYTVNGLLTIASGSTLIMNGHALSGNYTTSGTGTLNIVTTSSTPLTAGRTYSFNVSYTSASAQTIVAGIYNGTLNGTGGNRTLSATGTITIGADFIPGSGTYTTNNGSTVSFASNALPQTAQSIPAFTFNNLIVNNTAGLALVGNVTVNGALTLTNGLVSLGNNNLTLGAAATIAGTPGTGKYIATSGTGDLVRKSVANTATLFPIGTANSYAPLTITNTSGTSDLSAAVQSSFTNAPIDTTKMVNLEWSVSGTAQTTATIAFQFNAADKATGYNVGTNDLGIFSTGTSYATSAIATSGTTTITGTKTLVPILNGTNSYLVIGNTGAVESPFTTWTSNSNTGWSNPANWNNGVPTNGTDPIIAATNASPVFTGTQTIGKLIVNSGATLVINGTLNATSTLTNNGTISGTGTIVLSGSTAQTILGTGTVKNLTLNNSAGATVTSGNNKLNINGTLTLRSGQLTTNANVVFKSTSIANSGILAPVNSGVNTGTISGTVQVERFIPSGYRAYRDIAPSLHNAGSIYSSWQEGGSYANAGYGTFITGTTAVSNVHGVDATFGIDQSPNSVKSAFTFSGTGWSAVTNTKNTNLNPFAGYRLLVRGDRTSNLVTSPVHITGPGLYMMWNATALRASGTLVTGNVSYGTSGVTNAVTGSTYNSAAFGLNGANDSAFNMVANPYVAPIDWKNIVDNNRAVNLAKTYWYLDPTIGVSGAYVAYNALADATSGGPAETRRYIQAGQAFFVQNTATSPSLTITEADKAVDAAKTAVFGKSNKDRLVFALNKLSNGESLKTDVATVVFAKHFGTGIGSEDALKLKNSGENLSIVNSGKSLSIDARNFASENDRLPLALEGLSDATYQLNIDASAYSATSVKAFLHDAYLDTDMPLENGLNNVSFTAIKTEPATYANRFTVVFKTTNKAIIAENAANAVYGVYPNPIVGNKIGLRLSNAPTGKYTVVVTNVLGQIVAQSNLSHPGGIAANEIGLGQLLPSGTYGLTVRSLNENQVVYKTNVVVK